MDNPFKTFQNTLFLGGAPLNSQDFLGGLGIGGDMLGVPKRNINRDFGTFKPFETRMKIIDLSHGDILIGMAEGKKLVDLRVTMIGLKSVCAFSHQSKKHGLKVIVSVQPS